MKKIIMVTIMLFQVVLGMTQNNLKPMDDLGRITLSPVILGSTRIPDYAQTYAQDKLNMIVTQYALGSTNIESRFIITINLVEISKNFTPTQPVMTAVTLSPTLYIGDAETGTLYSSCALPVAKGAGTNENKAYIQAIRSINIQNPSIANFIEEGKQKIIEFYNSQIGIVMTNVDALVENGEFEEALYVLATVPAVCKEAYAKAQERLIVVYKQKIDVEGLDLLNKATQTWNSNLNYSGAEVAAEYLKKIDPSSSSAKAGFELSQQIKVRLSEIDAREWDLKMRQYEDAYNLAWEKAKNDYAIRSQIISAAREVGIAKAKQKIVYNQYNTTYKTSYNVSYSSYRYTNVNWW